MDSKEEMGMSVDNLIKGRGQFKVVGDFFQGDDAGGTIWGGGDVGDDPPYGSVPGGSSNTR